MTSVWYLVTSSGKVADCTLTEYPFAQPSLNKHLGEPMVSFMKGKNVKGSLKSCTCFVHSGLL